MIIKNLIKKIKARKAYKDYVMRHKRYILRAYWEMMNNKGLEWIIQDPEIAQKLWLRALEHDDDKLEKHMFEAYRKHFYPINDKEKELNEENFQQAWRLHYLHNDHHWQHRTNWKDEDFDINTELACLENIMDWLAVGYEFHDRPYQYYDAHKDEIKLPKKQIEFMEKCIYAGIDREYLIEERERNEAKKKKEQKENNSSSNIG